MDQHSKAELIGICRKRSRRGTKSEKGRITDTMVEATGHSRRHVIRTTRLSVRTRAPLSQYRQAQYWILAAHGTAARKES